jgi:hypothetical protein
MRVFAKEPDEEGRGVVVFTGVPFGGWHVPRVHDLIVHGGRLLSVYSVRWHPDEADVLTTDLGPEDE